MTALPALWAALVLAGAWTVRPLSSRELLAVPLPRPRLRLGRVQRSVAAAIVAAVVVPLAAPAVGLAVWLQPALAERRRRRRHQAAVLRSLPEVVDLLHLAVGAGLTVPLAVEAVGRRASGPLADALAAALAEAALGRRLADALADVPGRTSEAVRPLVDALVASDRYGAPLARALDRLAAEVRADRRRRAEEAARRVPVKLLFPLVCCVLPAFGLLTLAPLLAGAVAALRL